MNRHGWLALLRPGGRPALAAESFPIGDESQPKDEPPVSERTWHLTVLAMHIAFAALIVLAALDVMLTGEEVAHGRIAGLAAAGVLALTYAGFGRRALVCRSEPSAVAYLVVLTLSLGVLAWSNPDALFLLFIAYTQVWFLVGEARPGLVWTLLVFIGTTTGLAVHLAAVHESIFGAVTSQLIGLAFSVVVGVWTYQVIAQSARQSQLIAQLEAKEHELAAAHHAQGVLAERQRLAREVHDTLAQGYTSIVLLAQTAASAIVTDPAAARERVELIEEVARDNLREARAFMSALSPVESDDTSLVDALATLVDRFSRETGAATALHAATDVAGLRRDEQVVLLRAAQEALSNARRHAGATHVTLHLEREADGVCVRVVDDGVGVAEGGFRPGRGLAGLRRRMELAGGSLEVGASRCGGTELVARVVVPDR